MQTELDSRNEMIRLCRLLWSRGWVANHDGNVTMRLGGGRILATPTGISKNLITVDQLLLVDAEGRKLGGRTRPFSELGLHLRVYRLRPDVHAVLHGHPPTATGFALAGMGLDIPAMPEPVVSLGPGVPTVPYAFPGAEAEAALAPFVQHHDAVLLARHGVLTWGVDPEQAYLRMELVEHLARITLVAYQLGGVPALPADHVERLMQARAKAGLGPAGRAAQQAGGRTGTAGPAGPGPAPRSAAVRLPGPCHPRELTSGAMGPVPVAVPQAARLAPPAPAGTVAADADQLTRLIAEEVARALEQRSPAK